MGLTSTVATRTSAIPDPVLHAFSSERRAALGIPAKGSFYEEATFWNTQWGTPDGANQTTTIDDMVTTAVEVGSGTLLSPSSYEAMTGSNLLGFGHVQDTCKPSCFPQTEAYNYGLGVARSGSWLLQNPLLSGQGAIEAYLPSQQIAIAVVVTSRQMRSMRRGTTRMPATRYSNRSPPISHRRKRRRPRRGDCGVWQTRLSKGADPRRVKLTKGGCRHEQPTSHGPACRNRHLDCTRHQYTTLSRSTGTDG
jgi:hypothetical protein